MTGTSRPASKRSFRYGRSLFCFRTMIRTVFCAVFRIHQPTIVITDRGEPVAELKPLHGAVGEGAKLEQLKVLGAVTRLENRPLAPFRPLRGRGRSVSEAILEDRNDRT